MSDSLACHAVSRGSLDSVTMHITDEESEAQRVKVCMELIPCRSCSLFDPEKITVMKFPSILFNF